MIEPISSCACASSNMSGESNAPKADLGLLEEDDEFEEFPIEGLNELGRRERVPFV